MSEQADESQKTEEPTPKKLNEARERGNIAVSREINTWLMLFAGGLLITFAFPSALHGVKVALIPFVEAPHLFIMQLFHKILQELIKHRPYQLVTLKKIITFMV